MKYVAVVLTEESRGRLLARFAPHFPVVDGWSKRGDHMTVRLGHEEDQPVEHEGREVELIVSALAISPQVIAVSVTCEITSVNSVPHITLAIHRERGGASKLSNALMTWEPIAPMSLRGIVTRVTTKS